MVTNPNQSVFTLPPRNQTRHGYDCGSGKGQRIADLFGIVPSFFKEVADSSLELEWPWFKRVQFDDGPIPNKYRELIGAAIAPVTACRYCSVVHTEVAKLNGATEAKMEDAVHYAKSSVGWSTFINGLQTDYDRFKDEVLTACRHVRSTQTVKKAS